MQKLLPQEQRQLDQMSLDTFTFNRHNILDHPVDRLVQDIQQEMERLEAAHEKWVLLEQNDPKRYQELEEQANLSGDTLQAQQHGYIMDLYYYEDELFALYEMKIIYAFKHLEINLKQLLYGAYQDPYINRQFKWDSIVQYLSTKQIKVKELQEWENITQLRNLNNSLKHSDRTIDESIKNVPELKGKEIIMYRDLAAFYERVKQSPKRFLLSLVSLVYQDLYSFPQERIEELAHSFALRMDKQHAEAFCKLLSQHYQ